MLTSRYSKRSSNLSVSLLLAIAVAGVATGCGQAMPSKKSSSGTGIYNLADEAELAPDSAAGGALREPFRIKVQGTGYDTQSIKVVANQVLKVRFVPGKQNQEAADGNFYQYSMLGVYLGVGTMVQPTELLANGYGGYPAAQSTVIDLSDSFEHLCGSDPSCRQYVTIKVTKPNNDDGCLNGNYALCPYNRVPDSHPWNGTLVIQTDDTSAI